MVTQSLSQRLRSFVNRVLHKYKGVGKEQTKMSLCPKIKCFWGFHCAFCINDSRHKFPICERHIHKWETLDHETKRQIYSHVNLFNTGASNRRMLQIFIHRIEILDELNRIKLFYVYRDLPKNY